MKIDTIVMGDFQTNCYCVRADDDKKECLLIDPGLEPEPLVHFLKKKDYVPVAVALTHGHADHIGGVETIRQHWPEVEIAIHRDDVEMLSNPSANLSVMAGCMVQTRRPEVVLDGETGYYHAAGMQFKVLHTPGHTPGGICLHAVADHIIFVGDTLFAGSIGRSDFPGGNHELLVQMIKDKLLVLPEETSVYSGHGPGTSIAFEKRSNPFLSQGSL